MNNVIPLVTTTMERYLAGSVKNIAENIMYEGEFANKIDSDFLPESKKLQIPFSHLEKYTILDPGTISELDFRLTSKEFRVEMDRLFGSGWAVSIQTKLITIFIK